MRRKHHGKGRRAIDRRTFLKGAAAAAGMATLGGIPGILHAGQAPAYPKGTKLHLLTRLNFFPAADKIFLAQAEEFGKQMGVEVQVERVGQNDIVTRTTAAIVSGSGADIIILHNNFPHLVADGLADVSDVAEEIGKQQGGYYDLFRADASVGDRWLGVPHVSLSTAMNYREDWLWTRRGRWRPSSSIPPCGRSAWTKGACPGTTPATTALSSPGASRSPPTGPASTSRLGTSSRTSTR
ncbi:MAG: extracellular solute-binding protein [candidate division NC10 bacterium]|nr:extracellular solute-binding protein [candidate division NC10 bacterium]